MKKICKLGLVILVLIINQQAFSQKEIEKSPVRGEQQIEVSEGFSFVSSRFIPGNPDMEEVVQEILNDDLQYIRNSSGAMLRKIGPNWVNGIGDWIGIEGYLIKNNVAGQFTIEGTLIPQDTPIELSTGFQFVSYLPTNEKDALEAFSSIIGDNLLYVRNSEGNMLRKIGPNWINGIGDCNPGEGYLVKMNNDDVLIYPSTLGVPCPGIPTVTYEGQVYNTVLIGNQCWFKENLNIGEMINGSEGMTNNGVIEKYCYDNDSTNCETYGGLYQWNEMMEYTTFQVTQGICPAGWHLPTDDEWKILEGTVDSQYPVGDPEWDEMGYRGYDVGINLKSTSGWDSGGNGSGLYGFSALPGGNRITNGNFISLGYNGNWWSSTETNSYAFTRSLVCNADKSFRTISIMGYGISVRCLRYSGGQLPTVTTATITSITQTTATSGGNVSDNGGFPVTARGVCWSTNENPTLNDDYTTDGSGTGIFISEITGLTANTSYCVRAYATNRQGVAYGNQETCTTQSGGGDCPETFTYQGQVYEAVSIGDQCWMAENLNIGTMINGNENMSDDGVMEKYCYDNDPANCEFYGGLYQWNEMMQYTTTQGVQGICPIGWHLPTDDEWKMLEGTVDSQYPVGDPIWNLEGWRGYDVGEKLKSSIGWNSGGNGINDFEFTALPGGYRNSDGGFGNLTIRACFWPSSEYSSYEVWGRTLQYDQDEVFRYHTGNELNGLSARCLQD